jgi:hypothetical protein
MPGRPAEPFPQSFRAGQTQFGFIDEVWFSRLAQPTLHSWTAGEALRLGLHPADRIDPEPKALGAGLAACLTAGASAQRADDLAPACPFLQLLGDAATKDVAASRAPQEEIVYRH